MSVVRMIERDDEQDWRALWSAYLRFYETELDPAITDHTWSRLFDPQSPLTALVVEHDGAVRGFALLVPHEGTWTRSPICYLEDLYVAEDQRGTGLGRTLLDGCLALARERGWSRFYWHTDRDNHRARRLYDSYVPADEHVRYRITLVE